MTWIGSRLAYHEVLEVGERMWDPSEARWFDGVGDSVVAGRVVAVRYFAGDWIFK